MVPPSILFGREHLSKRFPNFTADMVSYDQMPMWVV
jgi:hypothetical protein